MSLREATAENHKNAEKQPFVGIMFGGKLPDEVYAIYLWNLYLQYETLETFADENGVINTDELAELYRAPKIKEDFPVFLISLATEKNGRRIAPNKINSLIKI